MTALEVPVKENARRLIVWVSVVEIALLQEEAAGGVLVDRYAKVGLQGPNLGGDSLIKVKFACKGAVPEVAGLEGLGGWRFHGGLDGGGGVDGRFLGEAGAGKGERAQECGQAEG